LAFSIRTVSSALNVYSSEIVNANVWRFQAKHRRIQILYYVFTNFYTML